MAKITIEDESKVMDVAAPGKGKIVGTSRPVVGPIASDVSKKSNISDTVPEEESVQVFSPSASKRVIQPISAPEEETVNSDEVKETVTAENNQEVQATSSVPEDIESSDAAGVNALAESVNSKKENALKVEEQARRDEEVQKLIDSKKYVVPIGKEGSKTKTTKNHTSGLWLLPILIILAAAASAYLLIDGNVINANVELPFDLIK